MNPGGVFRKMKDIHREKMIAPLVITAIVIIYYIVYGVLLMWLIPGTLLKIAAAVLPAVMAAQMIFVLRERMHEIRSGEEDDLSKY